MQENLTVNPRREPKFLGGLASNRSSHASPNSLYRIFTLSWIQGVLTNLFILKPCNQEVLGPYLGHAIGYPDRYF
jgi:hypothetical protein